MTGPASGSLSLRPDGSFTYTPNPNFNGSDSFTYTADDGIADAAPATVTITVDAVNDASVALDDRYSVDEDSVLTVAAPGVIGNDTDVDGDALAAALVSAPAHGAVSLSADGSFTYTPEANLTAWTGLGIGPATEHWSRRRRRWRSPWPRSTTHLSRRPTAHTSGSWTER